MKFVDEIVVRYLENSSFCKINGKYCYDEYDHGSIGAVQSYQDILGITDIKIIGRLMIQRLQIKNKRLVLLQFKSKS